MAILMYDLVFIFNEFEGTAIPFFSLVICSLCDPDSRTLNLASFGRELQFSLVFWLLYVQNEYSIFYVLWGKRSYPNCWAHWV